MAEGNAQRRFLEQKLKDYDVNVWPGGAERYDTRGRTKRSPLPKGVRPSLEALEPTTVGIQMFINSFGSLNAANMDYSIDVFLRQYWNDHRLMFNNTRAHFTITDPIMQAKIFLPKLLHTIPVLLAPHCYDGVAQRLTTPAPHSDDDATNMKVVLVMGLPCPRLLVTLTLACSMEFEHYPFDAQECGTSISSYANTEDVILYDWVKERPIDLPDELEIAQFDLMATNTEDDTQVFVTGNFSALRVNFKLRRQNGYHVLQTYVPTILIVSISWVSFWLDPNAVPGRVSLGVTTLLTLTTLASGIRAQLPPVSYVKAIDVWIGMCMIMVFGALLEFTFVNWLANKKVVSHRQTMFKIPKALSGSDDAEKVGCHYDDDDGDHVDETKEAENGKQQDVDEDGAASKTPKTYMNYARAFDRLCRAIFPGGFLIFNLVYWPYYLVQQQLTLEETS
ncbi:glycine receptor subunit alpha-2-like [Homarus americanus]|uniref:glycine receptor subunit alpha-2-like n=1 Tax=Homarus americanus TaxID=6706 RepID=UPI001C4784A3|nr:glycine receptor subunit alpha-2-like [Homarus americanus]